MKINFASSFSCYCQFSALNFWAENILYHFRVSYYWRVQNCPYCHCKIEQYQECANLCVDPETFSNYFSYFSILENSMANSDNWGLSSIFFKVNWIYYKLVPTVLGRYTPGNIVFGFSLVIFHYLYFWIFDGNFTTFYILF